MLKIKNRCAFKEEVLKLQLGLPHFALVSSVKMSCCVLNFDWLIEIFITANVAAVVCLFFFLQDRMTEQFFVVCRLIERLLYQTRQRGFTAFKKMKLKPEKHCECLLF